MTRASLLQMRPPTGKTRATDPSMLVIQGTRKPRAAPFVVVVVVVVWMTAQAHP